MKWYQMDSLQGRFKFWYKIVKIGKKVSKFPAWLWWMKSFVLHVLKIYIFFHFVPLFQTSSDGNCPKDSKKKKIKLGWMKTWQLKQNINYLILISIRMTVVLLWSSDFLGKKIVILDDQGMIRISFFWWTRKIRSAEFKHYWNWFGMIGCPRAHPFLLQTLQLATILRSNNHLLFGQLHLGSPQIHTLVEWTVSSGCGIS